MKRSKFSLSHYKLLSCDMGELIPIGLTEVLPGDSIQHATSCLVRVSPLLAPMMHPVQVRIHHWFVPHRLVWQDWEDFITGGPDGDDDSEFPTVEMDATWSAVGLLGDYYGIPPLSGAGEQWVSALPFRGYNLIFNEWYRDQDLVAERQFARTSGPDASTWLNLANVAWEKDYFTSARPWPQKGPEVTIPIGTSAPVVSDGNPFAMTAFDDSYTGALSATTVGNDVLLGTTVTSNQNLKFGDVGLEADLSSATPVSVNALREAFALQRFAEARARYGSRYTEYLRYLGVRSSDARLQRPEYLGGGKQTLQISEVLQTGVTTDGDDTEGVGNLKGHGIGALRSNRYRRFFEEHGYIHSLLSVKPRTMYTQGISRTFNRRIKEDFFQKELQAIGQQEVLNKEIYANQAGMENVFGYQDRYDEYRRMESGVSGEFRTTQLDFWHMARIFASAPSLNSAFVTSTPTKRVNAVQTNDVLWIMANHSIQARRIVAKTGASFIF